jgi:hypothetical protein
MEKEVKENMNSGKKWLVAFLEALRDFSFFQHNQKSNMV